MRNALAVAVALTVVPLAVAQSGRFSTSGSGCPQPPVFYEQFTTAGTGDLAGQSYLLTFTGSGYAVIPCPSGCFDTNFSGALNVGDDTLVSNLALGFNFPVLGDPRGTTNAIDVSSNGWIGLFTGDFTSSDFTESVQELLDQSPRVAAWWDDLNGASSTQPASDVYFDTFTTPVQRAVITWDQMPQFSNSDLNTFQVQLFANGDMIWTWQVGCTDDAIVGFSAGGGIPDPGPIDYTAAVPFFAGPFGAPLNLDSSSIPAIGNPLVLDVTNVPTSGSFGVVNLGLSQVNVDLTRIGAPGCSLLVALEASLPMTLNIPNGRSSLTIPNNPAFVGGSVEFQSAVIAPGINGLNVITSNRGTALIGGPIVGVSVVCQGSNTFNTNTANGFFQVVNNSPVDIVGVQFDWVSSSIAAQSTMVFDTDQTGMADRFDGGNSTASGCLGTYRNGSDTATGLDYSVSPATSCDPAARTGWVGTNATATNSYRTVDYAFTGFNPGETFEVDMDTDGGAGIGGDDMAGMVVTIRLADGRRLTGEVVAIAADLGRVDL